MEKNETVTLGSFNWPADFCWPIQHSDSMIYLGLCHDFGMLNQSGIEIKFADKDYTAAKAVLKKQGADCCYEDVLFQIVRMGKKWTIYDFENEETLCELTLDQMRENIKKMPIVVYLEFINENDDANTANTALQYAFFGEVVYG
jgi:hypothetical protein